MSIAPVVTVVIPTRNRRSLIVDTLRGLDVQTLAHEKFEVVVVDNGSSDGTPALLVSLAPEFSFNLRVLVNPDSDRGPAPARNFGVAAAAGHIIAFTDSDCRPAEEWLERGIAAFDDADVKLATGPVGFKPEQRGKLGLFARRTVACDYEHPTYPTANAFYRRDTFVAHEGFNAELSFPNVLGQTVEAADTDLAWRIKEAGGRNVFVPSAIVYHEVVVMRLWPWLTEPARLFLLPAIVRLHPGLRTQLLSYGVFFYRRSIFYYALLVLGLVFVAVEPLFLLLFFPALALAAAASTRSLNPIRVARKSAGIALNAIKIYVMCAALIYGSIRYRSLVL